MTSVLFAMHMSKNIPPWYGGEWPGNEDHGAATAALVWDPVTTVATVTRRVIKTPTDCKWHGSGKAAASLPCWENRGIIVIIVSSRSTSPAPACVIWLSGIKTAPSLTQLGPSSAETRKIAGNCVLHLQSAVTLHIEQPSPWWPASVMLSFVSATSWSLAPLRTVADLAA